MSTTTKRTHGKPSSREKSKTLKAYGKPSEVKRIAEKAAAANQSISHYLIEAGMGRKVETIPAVNAKVFADLGRLGGNLSQIAKMVQKGIYPDSPEKALHALLMEIMDVVKQTRPSLIGAST